MDKMIFNTRIAPSPTGYFHIGTARTAYHNWLVARASGGKFILRIDDTDSARSTDDYVRVILDCMDWLGLDYDAIYYQSKRLKFYNSIANLLIYHSKAYKDGDAVLFNTPTDLPASWNDTIAGDIAITQQDKDNMQGMVLIKSDGLPTYNFCSILDDLNMGINRIIRGVDHISNTAKQVAILHAMGQWNGNIKFTHVGLIHGKDGKKISKRDGAKSVTDYRDDGYNPNALLNFLFRMGWSPSDANFDSKHKMINHDLAKTIVLTDGKFQGSKSKFDQAKLDFYDKMYKRIK